MKKELTIVLLLMSMIMGVLNVNAENIYYTNYNGVQMTKAQYDKMLKLFSEKKVSLLTEKEFEDYKDVKIINSDVIYEKEVFINEEYVYSEIVTKEEYENSNNINNSCDKVTRSNDSDYYETSYKRLSSNLIEDSNDFLLISYLTWKQVPACRSYDVFAFRLNHFSYVTNTVTGVQTYYVGNNYTNISYNVNSAGYKSFSNGAGFSMNLKDDTNITSFDLTITAQIAFDSYDYSEAHAYISYQHAQSSLSRTQSKEYSLSISGLGNVIYFSNLSIRNKYDGMAGTVLIAPIP